jgi:acetylcholinesterase
LSNNTSVEGPVWEQYTPQNERLMQLNGDDTKMIDDTFREAQMDYINSVPEVFFH